METCTDSVEKYNCLMALRAHDLELYQNYLSKYLVDVLSIFNAVNSPAAPWGSESTEFIKK